MSDILQVQEFLYQGMLSCDLFAGFNVVDEKKFLLDKEIQFNAIWQAPRAGRTESGAGFYIEMPSLEISNPNSLQRNLLCSIVAIEERNINQSTAGTRVSAEDMAELALDFMFNWYLGMASGFKPEKAAVKDGSDVFGGRVEGLLAYRASVSLRYEHRAIDRAAKVTLTEAPAYTFALATTTSDADIYFTLDGSFPGKSNPAAIKYTTAFTGVAGQRINAMAWRGDLLPSHNNAQLIT